MFIDKAEIYINEMATSSVMGKKAEGVYANRELRPALPQEKVTAIMCKYTRPKLLQLLRFIDTLRFL